MYLLVVATMHDYIAFSGLLRAFFLHHLLLAILILLLVLKLPEGQKMQNELADPRFSQAASVARILPVCPPLWTTSETLVPGQNQTSALKSAASVGRQTNI